MTIDRGRERSYGTGEVQSEPWSAWYCPEGVCKSEIWYVKADAWARKYWHIGEEPERSDWQVAANRPICPMCGTALFRKGQSEPEAIEPTLLAIRRTSAAGM